MTNFGIASDAIRYMSQLELKLTLESIKARQAKLDANAAFGRPPVFNIGDLVTFKAGVNHVVVGRVVKVLRVNVLVRPNDGGTNWKVNAWMLQPIKEMSVA
jgi:hypothetical protein